MQSDYFFLVNMQFISVILSLNRKFYIENGIIILSKLVIIMFRAILSRTTRNTLRPIGLRVLLLHCEYHVADYYEVGGINYSVGVHVRR